MPYKAGRVPGVYPTWAEAEAQITGFAHACHQKFETRAEADAFVAAGNAAAAAAAPGAYYAVRNGYTPGIYSTW